MTNEDLIAQQDELRTKRSFIGFISTALGVNDQTYAGQDGTAVNLPRQYQTIGVNGSVGVEGAPISNAQPSALMMSPGILILIGLGIAFLVLKK